MDLEVHSSIWAQEGGIVLESEPQRKGIAEHWVLFHKNENSKETIKNHS